MTLEKLEVGMKVANYRKLCELLNEPVKNGGSSKSAQLKEWELHFAFERQGNAYIITEIYATPKLSMDRRKTYMQYVEPLLLHYIYLEEIPLFSFRCL